MSCEKCEMEMSDPDWFWAEEDLLHCGCCKECGCICDGWSEKVAKRFFKRTGIFRMYSYKDTRSRGRLTLEVVLRGNVLFTVPLWQIRPLFDEDGQ